MIGRRLYDHDHDPDRSAGDDRHGHDAAVTLAANNTAVTVTIAKSLNFTVDTTAYELDMDPSLPPWQTKPRRLG